MLVQFISSETGEVLMYAETAKMLLQIIGKETTARGTFTQAEMAGAAAALREAIRQAAVPPEEDDDENDKKKEPVVGLSQRAWPLMDMLERTGRSGPDANIIWEASADFYPLAWPRRVCGGSMSRSTAWTARPSRGSPAATGCFRCWMASRRRRMQACGSRSTRWR